MEIISNISSNLTCRQNSKICRYWVLSYVFNSVIECKLPSFRYTRFIVICKSYFCCTDNEA